MRIRLISIFVVILGISQSLNARLIRHWTYHEMFDKSDLVVIANVVSTRDGTGHITVTDFGPRLILIGVITEFESSIIFKGAKDIKKFQLHHYRYQSPADEASVANSPDLVKIPRGQHASFLLFLVKESDGKYAPVTGQMDPAILSVLDLRGAAD